MTATLVGPAPPGEIPSGRSIRRYAAAIANRRSGAGLGELLGDVYYGLITSAIGFLVALGVAQALRAALPPPEHVPLDSGVSLPTLVVVVLVGLAGVLVSLAGRLGPVGAGGAEAAWWLGLPVGRRGLLRPAARRLALLAGVVAGVVVPVLDAGLLGDRSGGHVVRVAAAAVLGAAGLVLAAGVAQTLSVPRRATALVGDVVLAAAPLLAFVGAASGWHLVALPDVPVVVLAVLAVAVVGLALVLDRRLDRIPARSLRESGSVAAQAAGAVVSMDSRELGRALTDGAAPSRRRRSARLRLVRGPSSAIVVADALVLLRSARHMVQLVLAALLPVLVAVVPQLRSTLGFVIAVMVGGYVAMSATGEGARRAEMAPVLDRLLPLPPKRVRRLRMVVPGVAMVLWSVVAYAAVGSWAGDVAGWLVLGLVAAPVWAGAAVRSSYRPAPDWGGPLVSTPMGAVPGGVSAVLARGPDVVVLGHVPVLVALALGLVPPVLVLVQAVLSWIVLLVCSSTSTKGFLQRLMEQAEEDQKGRAGR